MRLEAELSVMAAANRVPHPTQRDHGRAIALATEGKGDRHHLCAAPSGPFRQMVPVPFFRHSNPVSSVSVRSVAPSCDRTSDCARRPSSAA